MTPEQEQLLIDILKDLRAACYREMGQEWFEEMIKRIENIKYAGKP